MPEPTNKTQATEHKANIYMIQNFRMHTDSARCT